jgi:excisionase family DNA binding protein
MQRSSRGRVSGPVFFTTHEAAQLLGVSLPTIVNWIKAGRIEAHRTPGGHRRIAQAELRRFAGAHAQPIELPPEAVDPPGLKRVLVVHAERDYSEMVCEFLGIRAGVQARLADGAFNAGYELGRFRPDLLILDMTMPDLDGFRLARQLREDPEARGLRLIGLSDIPDPQLEQRSVELGFDRVLRKPAPLDSLLEEVKLILLSGSPPIPPPR